MKELDLHELKVKEALECFIEYYNYNFSAKNREEFRVIHGYGASGVGGVICLELRKFLKDHREYLTYIEGDKFFCNPGVTVVKPIKKLPSLDLMLDSQILEFCNSAKTINRINFNFKTSNPSDLKKSLNKLVKFDKLTVFHKGKHKCYQRQS